MILALLACPAVDSAGPACPPDGAQGLEVGDVATDVAFTDCAGDAHSIAELCGQPALFVSWYGWCPSCGDNAELARSIAAEHPELAVVQLLEEDPLGEAVDAELCADFTEAYPSVARVWLDVDKRMEVYGTTDLVVVIDRDGTLTFVRETSTEEAIVGAVEGVVE